MTERSDPMDAGSKCAHCVRWNKDCPLDPVGTVRECVEYEPTDNQKAFIRAGKDIECVRG